MTNLWVEQAKGGGMEPYKIFVNNIKQCSKLCSMELRLEHNLGKAWCNDTGLFGTPDQGFWVSGIMQ